MAKFQTFKVIEIIDRLNGVAKIRLDDSSRAYAFDSLVGSVEVGDEVVCNTTAIDLSLGTGGWHFVVWNLAHRKLETARGGHIMKMRYTPFQIDCGVKEEFENYPSKDNANGLSVIAAPLHSHIAPIALYIKDRKPHLNVSVALSDGAALPVSLSDNMRLLKENELIDKTISFGHSFGGDIEALNIYTAILSAKHVANSDVLIVSMGPGIVGTNTKFGFTGIEVAYHLDAAKNLEADSIGVLRCSSADPRQRHKGVSHHSLTTYSVATSRRHKVGYISDHELSSSIESELSTAGIFNKHDIHSFRSCGIVDLMEDNNLDIKSMGRTAREDELFYESAAVASRIYLGEESDV